MKINKKRIRKVQNYLLEFKLEDKIRIATKMDSIDVNILKKLGFSSLLEYGEFVLPDAHLTRVSMENSEGRCITRRDIPKEKYDQYWEWSWEDWGGNQHYDFKYITKDRYVREYLKPEAIELAIFKAETGDKWVSTDDIINSEENYERIKLSVNLFLSLFGECNIINSKFETPIKVTRSCNWEILRPGHTSPQDIDKAINETIERNAPEGKKNLYRRGFNKLAEKAPEIIAVGTKGFSGYLVFEYPEQGIAILESLMPNNATYILNVDWEGISKLTKREVLDNGLHIDRLYHYHNWNEKIDKYLSSYYKEAI